MKTRVLVCLFIFAALCSQRADARTPSILETEHFKIIHDVNSDEATDIASLLEYAFASFNFVYAENGFNLHAPSEKLVWYCFGDMQGFSDHALAEDNMNLPWLTSYYSAKTNSVNIVKPSNLQRWKMLDTKAIDQPALAGVYILPSLEGTGELTRIMHEAAHQLAFNTGLQKQKVMYPIWVSEGLASNFETCIPADDGNIRQKRLLTMYRQNRMIPLNEFVLLTRMPEDSSQRKDIYAQACVFFKFLSEKHAESFKNYMAELYDVRTGWRSRAALHTEFTSAFGSIKEMDRSWKAYLKSLSSEK
jgi:hypothetical protein